MDSLLVMKCLLGAGGWGSACMAVTELEVDSPWPFRPRGVLLPVAIGLWPETSVTFLLGRGGRYSRDHFLVLLVCDLARVAHLTSVRADGEVCPPEALSQRKFSSLTSPPMITMCARPTANQTSTGGHQGKAGYLRVGTVNIWD